MDEGDEAAVEFVSALFDSNKQRAKTDKLILKISRRNEEFDSSFEELQMKFFDDKQFESSTTCNSLFSVLYRCAFNTRDRIIAKSQRQSSVG